jgi:signal transduction histidine kinase
MTSTSGDAAAGPEGGWPADPDERLFRLVHDLRTPLTIVSGFADLLRRRADLTEAQRAEYAERIAEAAAELCAILDSERADRRD